MSGDKAIRLESKPLLSIDIIKQDLALQSYLKEMVIENRCDEATRMKLAKARETKRNYYLKQKGKQAAKEIERTQQRMSWTCKKTDKK